MDFTFMSYPNITQDVVELRTYIENIKTNIIDFIYPIGSIYMSVNNISPATFLGGTWEQIQNRFLLSAGSSYEAGSTGGSSSHEHTLSSNGGATIRKYSSQFIMGRVSTAGNMPNSAGSLGDDGSWWVTNAEADTATQQIDTTKFTGVSLYGNTDITTNLPPYLTVYMWKRIS